MQAATKAHPAFKYAVAVAGIAALVAIVTKFGLSMPALAVGIVFALFVMFVFLIFSVAVRAQKQHMGKVALVVVWALALLFILVLLLLLSSSFFDAPIKLRSYFERLIAPVGTTRVYSPDNIVGTWLWPEGRVVQVNADGTASDNSDLTAKWRRSEGKSFEFEWSDDSVDRFVVSTDGKTLKSDAQYSDQVDQYLMELSRQAETAIAQADADWLSEADKRKFLFDTIGFVRAIKSKASLIPNNEDEIQALNALEERYQSFLADLARPLRSSLATGLRIIMLDLQQIQEGKKRRVMFTATRQE